MLFFIYTEKDQKEMPAASFKRFAEENESRGKQGGSKSAEKSYKLA